MSFPSSPQHWNTLHPLVLFNRVEFTLSPITALNKICLACLIQSSTIFSSTMEGRRKLIKEKILTLAQRSGCLESRPIHQKVVGSIPGWGAYGRPPSDVSLTIMFLSLFPLLSKINKHILRWQLKKKEEEEKEKISSATKSQLHITDKNSALQRVPLICKLRPCT